MARMNSAVPAMKVWGATLGSALSVILVWTMEEGLLGNAPRDIPEGVELAIATLMTFAAGYFILPARHDQIVMLDDGEDPVSPDEEATP